MRPLASFPLAMTPSTPIETPLFACSRQFASSNTSTFLSWPIAVVLTLVMLLGHWGVEQLGDATAPGIGNQVVNDLKLTNPAQSKAVSATVEKLSWLLNVVGKILPDISEYPALEDIERGVAVAPSKVGGAALVTFGFGIPLALLAYVFLKNKEVAP